MIETSDGWSIYNSQIKALDKRNSKGIRIPQLAKIITLYPDWRRSLNKKMGNYLTA